MATTTNYGWSTPDDTALVSQGAAAIRTLGSSVDTTVKALSPGTTAGDVDYYTSSTAKARLGIGTTGQVLTVAGGVPSWATSTSSGGMTLLSTTTLSGATVTVSSISQSYVNLFIYISRMTNATASGRFRIAPNGTTNISHGFGRDGNATVTQYNADYLYSLLAGTGTTTEFTSADNAIALTINNYASTTAYKAFSSSSTYNSGVSNIGGFVNGGIATNTAISSLVFSNAGGNLSTGTVLIYGVK